METTARAMRWLITINNPTADDRMALAQNPRYLKYIKYQDECAPSTGTLHVQGYIETDQVRMSSIKKWLHRAHIKPVFVTHEKAMAYASKSETAIAGTQHERTVKDRPKHMSMYDALKRLAGYYWDLPTTSKWLEAKWAAGNRAATSEDAYEAEYWDAVEKVVREDHDTISLYTQPQYLRAWLKLRQVVITDYDSDQEPDIVRLV